MFGASKLKLFSRGIVSRFLVVLTLFFYYMLMPPVCIEVMGQEARRVGQSSGSHEQHQHPGPTNEMERKEHTKTSIPNLLVVNEQGKKVRFYDDLVKGKVVAINFIYTSCIAVCPVQGVNFGKLQNLLGDRLGGEVNLISISTDPLIDTPERLKEWGKKFGAKPGWTFITGEKDEMDKLLEALTGDPARKGMHAPVVLIGSDMRGVWKRDYGLAAPSRLTKTITDLVNEPAVKP